MIEVLQLNYVVHNPNACTSILLTSKIIIHINAEMSNIFDCQAIFKDE